MRVRVGLRAIQSKRPGGRVVRVEGVAVGVGRGREWVRIAMNGEGLSAVNVRAWSLRAAKAFSVDRSVETMRVLGEVG